VGIELYLLPFFAVLAERDLISKRAHNTYLVIVRRGPFQTRFHISVILRAKFLVVFANPVHHHPNMCAGASIPVMFTQMQDESTPRDLSIQWSVGIESMIPVDREAEKSFIKLFGFGDIKYAEDGYDIVKIDCHSVRSGKDFWMNYSIRS